MYYNVGDIVRVIDEKGLHKNEFEVQTVSDDEETFNVMKIPNEIDTDNIITITTSRELIMENDEVDKFVKWFIKEKVWTLDEASDIDELEAYLEGEESDSVTVFQDETLDGMVMNFNSFSDVNEANDYFTTTFSHYSQNGLYKLDDTYYAIIIS